MRILRSIFFVNLGLIFFILMLSYAWVRISFRPIRSIIDNLSNIIDKKGYKRIEYTKRDEFWSLVNTINLLNENLFKQEKIRSDFLSDLSHEIKTPITAIKCYMEGMDDGVIESNEQNRHFLRNEIDRLIGITTSIMEYEKLEQEDTKRHLVKEPVDFIEALACIRDEYAPALSEQSQSIVLPSIARFMIPMDRNKCLQLLHNIFSNFIKYAGKNTTLTIRCYRRNHIIHLVFSDNGAGVAKEEIEFLKEKFYQVEKSRTNTPKRGLGIGLSIIEKIVRMYSGETVITSDIGKWFTLKIRLPVES